MCDETWNLAGSPYVVTCDVTVAAGCTLTIDAGVEVRFQSGTGLQVSGILDVNGASGSEVLLTSDAAVPAVGDWSGVQLVTGSTGTLDYATVSWADNGVYAVGAGTTATLNRVTASDNTYGVFVYNNAAATLTEVTASSNTDGLYVNRGDATQVDVSGGSFTGNNRYGVHLHGSNYAPSVTLSGASIHSNLGSHDLFTQNYNNATSTLIWALDNWWGTTAYDRIRQRIYDHDDSSSSPVVYFHAFGPSCEIALGRDQDRDGLGDFEDNCPAVRNVQQADGDGDGMGDACDPDPGTAPVGGCNGIDDTLDGYVDSDGDDWGDPCDFQPTRDDSYPGAAELCDGRDNDGDAVFALDELADADLDGAITCGDCDDLEPEVYPCACESCINLREDDCDGLMDGDDPECFENPYCVVVSAGAPEPGLHVEKAACGEATLSGPFDVIRGNVAELHYSSGSVDLGNVFCAGGGVAWDRVTDLTPDPNPACNDTVLYFVARDTGAADFGSSWPGGEPRDVMIPDPVCP